MFTWYGTPLAETRCCRCFALPLHILAFAWAQRSGPWSKPLWDSTPCFPGSPWRSSPTTRCSSYVPSAISELAAAEISPSAWILSFTPTELFLVFCALGKCRERYSGRVCAESCANLSETAPPWQWIDFSVFFSFPNLCLDQVEKTVCNLRLSPSSYMFHPASFKSSLPGSGCSCTF